MPRSRKSFLPPRLSHALDVLRGRKRAYGPTALLQAAREASRIAAPRAGYDGAKTGRHRYDWGTSTDVPYYELLAAHKKLRSRSRELDKNDSTYRAALRAIVNHVVGRGLKPKPRVVDRNGNPIATVNQQLEEVADRYLATKDWDAGGRMQFVGQGQRLALLTQLRDGDVILNAVRARPGRYLSQAWQMAVVDRLDDSKDLFYRTFEESSPIRQIVHGIGLDEYGAPVEYWFKGIEKPVKARNIIHSYLQERPEQYIGEPFGTSVLDTVYDKHDLQEDYLLKSRAIAKLIHWLSTLSDSWPYSGDQDSDDFLAVDTMSSMRTEQKPEIFKMPDDVSKTMEPLIKQANLDICAGLGVSYITVLLDMSDVNFAAASMNSIKEWINFLTLRERFIESFCQPVWEKTVLQAVIDGRITGVTRERYLADPHHYTRCEWTGDPREYADPVKTVRAAVENLKSGRTTLQQDLRERGIDPTEHARELEEQKALLEAAGISWAGDSGEDVPEESDDTSEE